MTDVGPGFVMFVHILIKFARGYLALMSAAWLAA